MSGIFTESQMLIDVQGTNRRNQHQLELEIENMGGHLNAYTSVCINLSLDPSISTMLNLSTAGKYRLLRQVLQFRRSRDRRHSLGHSAELETRTTSC